MHMKFQGNNIMIHLMFGSADLLHDIRLIFDCLILGLQSFSCNRVFMNRKFEGDILFIFLAAFLIL